ncbi:MAG: NUDIX hydrolase [Hyphomicrobiaceae bacterium]|nr:NUDIX hydrolase [Hyphomicrobiaceae bacterium]
MTEKPNPSLKILSSRTTHDRFCRLDVYELEAVGPSGRAQKLTREVEDHGPACSLLAYDPARKSALLVRQQRPAVALAAIADGVVGDGMILEAAAGLIDLGESGAEAARREAHEELGLAIETVEPVGSAHSMPGLSTEKIELFLASADFASARVGLGGGIEHEGEDIEVVEVALGELARLADAGGLADLKTLALVQTLRLKRPELF